MYERDARNGLSQQLWWWIRPVARVCTSVLSQAFAPVHEEQYQRLIRQKDAQMGKPHASVLGFATT